MANPNYTLPDPIHIRHHLQVGDIGRLVYLHGQVYAMPEELDYSYEAQIAHTLGGFIQNMDERDRIWVVENDGKVAGSVAIEERSEEEAQLQFFLLHPDLPDQFALGKHLIRLALQFCRKQDFEVVQLWAVSNQIQAEQVYRAVGFHMLEEKTYPLWGKILTEQRYELRL